MRAPVSRQSLAHVITTKPDFHEHHLDLVAFFDNNSSPLTSHH
jgi:hypothetical protein